MGLHINSNLALELPLDLDRPPVHRHDPRAAFAAQFIPAGARVFDLSAGKALECHLPNGCTYQRESARRKGSDIAQEFPTEAARQSDIVVMLGVLERIADVESLFTHLRFVQADVLLSYHPTDLMSEGRAGFANHLGFCDLTLLFDRYGFRIACTAPVDENQVLMRLTQTERLRPLQPCRVALVTPGGANEFGARIGLGMVQSLIPGEAEVHHVDLAAPSDARYDLVVVGAGNGLFQPLLNDALLDIIGRAKASIGIFGTQYRELIPRPSVERLIDRLDCWFARYEDDVLLYGRGRDNVIHLGDWLIDHFPLVIATADEPLEIDGALDELAIDRAIATIQRHRQVYAAAPAPFLCALTSAELAAYADSAGPVPAAGQFRSLLIDIFGRSYPEKKFFMVDRDAVARYKAWVHRNVANVRARIEATLHNVAVAG